MTISVVFTTFNNPAWLEKVLWGWACQTQVGAEIVIADDGSGPDTRQLIHRMRGETALNLLHVWQEDEGFQKSRILNKAIAASSGEYLVFTDGDCIPRADFLAVHAQLAKPGRFLSGGYVKLPMAVSEALQEEDVRSGRAFSPRWLRKQGAGGVKRLAKLSTKGWLSRCADALTTTRPSWNGHNASGWRSDIEAANGFDERMQYGGQDRELGERLENAGVRGKQIRYRAVCVHLDHARGYARMDSIRKNKTIRAETRATGRTRTEFGITGSGESTSP